MKESIDRIIEQAKSFARNVIEFCRSNLSLVGIVLGVVLLIAICVIPASCKEKDVPNFSDSIITSSVEELEDAFMDRLSGEYPILLLSVRENDGLYDLCVDISSSGSITYFGNYIYATKTSFEDILPADQRRHYRITLLISNSDPDNASIVSFSSDQYTSSSSGLSGQITDTRSGDAVVTRINSLDDLCNKYPALELHLSEPSSSDNVYPKNSSSKYLSELAYVLPAEIYNTPASENGLSGSVYCITADVVDAQVFNGVDLRIVTTTDNQKIAVLDFYNFTTALNPLFLNSEPGADYTMPNIGEHAELYLTYSGYSDALQLPAFYLGVNEYCVESLRDN